MKKLLHLCREPGDVLCQGSWIKLKDGLDSALAEHEAHITLCITVFRIMKNNFPCIGEDAAGLHPGQMPFFIPFAGLLGSGLKLC
ncbi:hypothetical protein D3C81_1924560 [compost metagenome]